MTRERPVVTAADLGIEPVTTYVTGGDRYRNLEPSEGTAARMIPVSLARVRWMDKPVDWDDDEDEE